jgi:hypothetical protein
MPSPILTSSDPRVVNVWISEHGGITSLGLVDNEFVTYGMGDGSTLRHYVENERRRHGWELVPASGDNE